MTLETTFLQHNLRMYLTELLFCDKHKFKRLNNKYKMDKK